MIQKDVLIIGLLTVIGVGVLAHAFFPRYEWRTVDHKDGVTLVIYDRWAGRFQRAVYDDAGHLNVMPVYAPF
jgi:hypothetical protein